MPTERRARQWLMLVYKIPREPTAGRVHVWRKLKQLGAVLLQDAVWVLPATPHTEHQFQWLAAEITELRGQATLWQSTLLFDDQEEALVMQFEAEVESAYREILRSLKAKRRDLRSLSRTYQQALARDYFHSQLGRQVRKTLMTARDREER